MNRETGGAQTYNVLKRIEDFQDYITATATIQVLNMLCMVQVQSTSPWASQL